MTRRTPLAPVRYQVQANGVVTYDVPTKPRKYRNTPTVVDGTRFASKAEANRYQGLLLLQRGKEISGLRLQPRYKLWGPDHLPVCVYIGDFEYLTKTGTRVCEDVKGVRTDVFRIKAALFEQCYPQIELRVVKA